VVVKFRNISDYEDNLYVDDINIASNPIGINQLENLTSYVNLYPNPSNGLLKFEVYNQSQQQEYQIIVYDIIGKKVKEVNAINSGDSIDLSSFTNGLYQLEIKNKTTSIFKKIVINK
jgi:hypothetical protein